MMRVRKEIYGLHGFDGVEIHEQRQIAGLREGITTHIDKALWPERCDLLVMGGVMRTRLTELVLGGVTRHFLKSASIPILMNVT